MKQIGILGSGPAALVTAMLLHREGYRVEVFGTPRRDNPIEGVSWRALDGIKRAGFLDIEMIVNQRWNRISTWGGKTVEANGEYVVHRRVFDEALLAMVRAAGIAYRKVSIQNPTFSGGVWRGYSGLAERTSLNEVFLNEFLVDARGGAAIKLADNEADGPVSVALTYRFSNASRLCTKKTYIEPFRRGWVWATHDENGDGYIQIVVSPETIKGADEGLRGMSSVLFNELSFVPSALGKDIKITSPIEVRGIHPVLRSKRVSSNYLRVGDSSYSCDPLSGHGIFEAVSGAYAALPVINTLLRDSESAPLAIQYYDERTRSVFLSRMATAHEFYASETRWMEEEFWSQRYKIREIELMQTAKKNSLPSSGFMTMPVVENGYIVERNVALVPGLPRGVRFVDGVELAQLRDAIIQSDANIEANELAVRLGFDSESIRKAWLWLYNHSLIGNAPT